MWKIQKLLCCLLLALSILSGCSLSEKNEDKVIASAERIITKFLDMAERIGDRMDKRIEEKENELNNKLENKNPKN